jgi:hypothetical protein
MEKEAEHIQTVINLQQYREYMGKANSTRIISKSYNKALLICCWVNDFQLYKNIFVPPVYFTCLGVLFCNAMECNALYSDRILTTIRKNVLPPSSASKVQLSFFFQLAWLTLQHGKCSRDSPRKLGGHLPDYPEHTVTNHDANS